MSLLDWLVQHFLPDDPLSADPALPQAVARILGGTDPRLKALGDAPQRLAPVAASALAYARTQAAALPPAVAADPTQWATTPTLRALFVRPDEMARWLARQEEIATWYRRGGAPQCQFLLVAGVEEKQFIGTALRGDTLQQDVIQHSVSFVRQRVLAVADSPEAHHAQVCWQIFDQLVLAALHALAHARSAREELAREAALLQARLLMLRRRRQHLDGALAHDPLGTVEQLEAQLKSNTEALQKAQNTPCTLDECLKVVIEALAHPEAIIASDDRCWRLNPMNVAVAPEDPEGRDICLREVHLHLPEAKQGVAIPLTLQRDWLTP